MPVRRLQQLYAEKYEPLALRSRRPNTKRLYRSTLRDFDRYLARPATLDDLRDDTVSGFADNRRSAGLSPHTVNKHLYNILALWRWLHRKNYLDRWPDVAMEQTPRRAPIALTETELSAVCQSIEAETLPVGSHSPPDYWQAKLLVIWDTGERIGAVMALRWSDVDLRGKWVRFRAEHRKGCDADNVLPIAADTVAALKKIRRVDGLVFDWPYSKTHIYYRLGAIMRRAGLPHDRWHKFHCIRKSTASHLEAAGGNATALLGHSSRKVTRSYLDPRIVQPQRAIDLLFRPGARPQEL